MTIVDAGCASCPAHNVANLKKLALSLDDADYVVALAGNPNTGKTTVFNALTGLRQHTGNWPGKTVTRAEGAFSYHGKKYKIVDLPGTYSLLSASTDEEIARNFILFGQPDVTVIVVDSTRLERNLNLVLQVLEITNRAVVCLNLSDEAKRHGLQVNDRILAKELGVPVVPTSARRAMGLEDLLQAIHDVATGVVTCKPRRLKDHPTNLERAITQLAEMLRAKFPGLSNARWVALRLLEGDKQISDAVASGDLASIALRSGADTQAALVEEAL